MGGFPYTVERLTVFYQDKQKADRALYKYI